MTDFEQIDLIEDVAPLESATEVPSDLFVEVAVPVRVPTTFTYALTADQRASLVMGSVVQVPFRNRLKHGFVISFPETCTLDRKKLKAVESILVAEPLFDETMLKFLRWVSDYYCHPIGEVIAAAIPKPNWSVRKRRKRKDPEAVDSLKNLGIAGVPSEKPKLTEEQTLAVSRILDPGEKRPVLLHGVTGSGKTEVYMSVLESVLGEGRGAIILVPEIALTPQLMGRFSGRFPGRVAVLHSDLTIRERFDQWERIRTGTANIVVGARSAIFAPIKNLGLIVVDEEHESSFKQEDQLRYHGRDIATVRAHFEGAKVVLGSATPSMESYQNAQSGKYLYVALKNRVQNRPMPKTTFVDLKDKSQFYSPKTPWLSRFLVHRVEQTLKAKQQAMLYLNRLGFAHFLFCRDCGNTWRCLNCDVALTYYKNPPLLKCHYCGTEKAPPEHCDACQGTALETMGVGTEQVEKELKLIFPEARIARMDRSIIKTRSDLEAILNSIAAGEIDIVIGTQMIAKGHDFPGVTLVGILVADASLNLPDFRAHEKTFQAITQVSGRAGRAEHAGEVVIQTINPEHPVLVAAAQNRSSDFYRLELATRSEFGFPPFQRMAMLRFQHANMKSVEVFAFEITHFMQAQLKKNGFRCTVIGPAEAPLAKIKNLYRWQCMVKSESVRDMQSLLRRVHEYALGLKTSVQLAVDIDPMSSL